MDRPDTGAEKEACEGTRTVSASSPVSRQETGMAGEDEVVTDKDSNMFKGQESWREEK